LVGEAKGEELLVKPRFVSKYLLEIFYENVVGINLDQGSVSGKLLYIE
jgi:hypothetical protein